MKNPVFLAFRGAPERGMYFKIYNLSHILGLYSCFVFSII